MTRVMRFQGQGKVNGVGLQVRRRVPTRGEPLPSNLTDSAPCLNLRHRLYVVYSL